MGIILSTTRYAPFSLVTGILGIIGFIFTLGTFFKVLWTNFTTLGEAPHEVHALLTNLRTELLEEKASIRIMRKQSKKWRKQFKSSDLEGESGFLGIELDEVTLKTMGDSVKWLVRRFRELERPFLETGEEGIMGERKRRRAGSEGGSPYYEHSAYAPPHTEKGNGRSRSQRRRRSTRLDVSEDDEENDSAFWAQRVQYCDFTLKKRFMWLQKKSEALSLYDALTRVQVRRTARQVGGMSYLMHEYGDKSCRTEVAIRRIEERLNNIVGVRRVD
ncbi:hypothetical protein HII31_00847 [Pseudocercospora fuligena]|uniref:Uncharacterized protein n=1 Tax=Pseudocercospora fuligena TaxID=685502 RepID=A0A8H6VMF6_9PEZI|nr:hypothetical protein HII31_00847 [Pseudocercospora fuligena]